jgi:hypothetical protein
MIQCDHCNNELFPGDEYYTEYGECLCCYCYEYSFLEDVLPEEGDAP